MAFVRFGACVAPQEAWATLDRRIRAGEWANLAAKDIVSWLDAHGCSLKYALECDTVDKDPT